MNVQSTRHVDAGEIDGDGLYDYHYEYDILVFSHECTSLIARSYTDTPHEAHFLSIEVGGRGRLLTWGDLKIGLFGEAVAYLQDAGKREIKWLSGKGDGYEPIPERTT